MRIFCLALTILSMGCSPQLAEGVHLVAAAGEWPLEIGESLRTEKKSPDMITFLDVVEDSRCPRGVNCIQAGRAVVAVEVLRDGTTRRMEVEIEPKTTVLSDRGRLSLLSLEPYPDTGVEEAEPYRLLIRWEE